MTELGQALIEARNANGLSLEDIQEMTKIQKRYLVAIEKGDYHLLPGQFYIRAFIKSYAEAVGLDVEELFTQYSNDIPRPPQVEVENLPSRKGRTPIKAKQSKVTSIFPKLLVVAVLVVICIGIYIVALQFNSGNGGAENTDSQVDNVTMEKGNDIGDHQTKTNEGTSSAEETDNKDQESADEKQASDKADSEDEEATQKLTVDNTSGSSSTYTLTDTDKFVVEIEAEDGARSWVTAANNNAQGEKYFYNNISSGISGQEDVKFEKDLSDIDTLYLKIGDTRHAIVKINGEVLEYPSDIVAQSITIHFKKS